MSDERPAQYFVRTKDLQTGEVSPPTGYPYEWARDDPGADFWWSEGNMRCDCNRWAIHWRAMGRDEDGLPEDRCDFGKNRFLVHITAPSGEVLYSEFEP